MRQSDKAVSQTPGRRFFVTTLATVLIVLGVALVAILATGPALKYQELLEYQQSKLDQPLPKTIFVGDSSLGNAIDVDVWRELTGELALNLALTGKYGYAGSLGMMREAVQAGGVESIVIFQTASMMKRAVNERAEDAVRRFRWDVASIKRWWLNNMNLATVPLTFRNSLRSIRESLGLREAEQPTVIQNDYVAQGPPVSDFSRYKPLSLEYFDPKKIGYLKKISRFCVDHGVSCVYVHGPLEESMCLASDGFFDQVNMLISEAGLSVVESSPVCIPVSQLGDGEDHVLPEFKAKFTRKYAEILAPDLYPRK